MKYGNGNGYNKILPALGESIDPDVRSFITATGITSQTIIDAISELVFNLKSNNLWGKIYAIYPFVGGSASSHSYNLKNTAQFQITWGGGVTHNANGITGNGTTGFGLTGYVIQSANQNNFHISAYIRNNSTSGCAIGTRNVAANSFTHIFPLSGGSAIARVNSNGNAIVASSDSRGFYVADRPSSASQLLIKNGTQIASSATTSTTPSPNQIALMSRALTTATVDNFSNYNLALVSIGETLSAGEQTTYYNNIQSFQTFLSRQV